MKKILIFCVVVLTLVSCTSTAVEESGFRTVNPVYKSVDEANPLKGFLPFMTESQTVPHSMEFFYIPLKKIMLDENSFDFSELESKISTIAERGNQVVMRVYLDYPDVESGTPEFFWNNGIEKITYTQNGKEQFFPDYTNQKCIDYLLSFINEFGKKYDGDPRIGFIFCGLIGHWGEWHNTYYASANGYADTKMPSENQQMQIFTAFNSAFEKTFCLVRYPTTKRLSDFSRIGFHDDSFTEDTFDDTKGWYFMTQLKSTGMTERWRTAPVGGEFRPENQLPFLRGKKYADYYQDYDKCVDLTHCSWLLYDAAFYGNRTAAEKKVAWKASKKLGYDLTLSSVKGNFEEGNLKIDLNIENRGAAPFYYDWKPEIVLLKNSEILKTWSDCISGWNLPEILPGKNQKCKVDLDLGDFSEEDLQECTLSLYVPNPMENGAPLKFSNKSLNATKPGCVDLVKF